MRLLSLLFFLTALPLIAQEDTSVYTQVPKSRDGIGKVYMGREISHVMSYHGAPWLERDTREREEKPRLVVRNMDLERDAVVADIGAGSGYFTRLLAKKVRNGNVYAVEIQQEMLDILNKKLAEEGIDNVTPVLGTITSPNLPPESVDAVLMVDVYHEFSHPREMMLAIMEALKPDGRVYLVEYRGEDPAVRIKPLHKMTETQARKEMEAVGLAWVETIDKLPRQHLMVFEKASQTK